MTFDALDAWWWPYLFIVLAGAVATDVWRFLGVYVAGGIAEDSDIIVLVRCVATALVAAVIANLIVFPSGALAGTAPALRVGAALTGFGVYLFLGRSVLMSIIVAEAVLLTGIFLL